MKRFGRLSDFLLLPAGVYARLKDTRFSLIMGIAAIGVFDVFLPDFIGMYKSTYVGKTPGVLNYNILLSVAFIALLGIVDVLFFSLPLYDIFKFLKKREGTPSNASAVKVAKVYIMSNLMLAPIITLVHYAVFKNANMNNPAMVNLDLLYFFIVIIWQSSMVSRGINVLFAFNPIFRRLTFIVVFIWNYLLSMVIAYQIESRLLSLLK